MLKFKLNEEFLAPYKKLKPNFGFNGLGELVYLRTYSRIKEDGSKEVWFDTVLRVVEWVFNTQKTHIELNGLGWKETKAQKLAMDMFDRMFNMKFLPSGRGLWMAGSKYIDEKSLYAALNSCAFVSTDDCPADNPAKPYTFLMDMSMLGVGVGFNVNGIGITIHKPSIEDNYSFTIKDSREGWVEALKIVINSFLLPDRTLPLFNYSEIRPYGELIKGFGGVASGSAPLEKLLNQIITQFSNREGDTTTITDIVDIMNKIACCVVAGNVRRSASIALSEQNHEFSELKHYTYNSEKQIYEGPSAERAEYGWASNNSIYAKVGMDYKNIAESIAINGEPGLFWLDNAKEYSRVCDPKDNADNKASGVNPCFTGDMRIRTESGYKTFSELVNTRPNLVNRRNEIVPGHVWSNGIKPILEIKAGSTKNPIVIKCTPDHKFSVDGSEVMAKDLKGRRLELGYSMRDTGFDNDTTRLGFIQGDGAIRQDWKKSRHKTVQVCFTPVKDDEVLTLFDYTDTTRQSIKNTSITYEELETSGFDFSIRKNRRLPRVHFNSNDFLCGLFSANGSVIKSGNRVALKTASIDEAKDVAEILASIGIESYTTTNKPKEVLFSNGAYECAESYDVNISQLSSLIKFAEQISFIQTYKRESLSEILENKRPYVYSIAEAGNEEVFDFSLQDDTHWGIVEGVIAHNCVEQTLESYELCTLVETFPTNCSDLEDYKKTLRAAYLYAKTITLCKTHWAESNRVMLRNRRIGTSITGIAQFKDKFGLPKLKTLLTSGYEHLKELDSVYSDWFCVPKSIKMTSVKPSGSVSLLAGCTPGVHYPINTTYLRRMRLSASSELVSKLREANYNLEQAMEDPTGQTLIVQIPVHLSKVRSEREVSMWEQLELAAFLQEHWADNQVSVTITFDPKTEGKQIASALDFFQYRLKGVSFLPRLEYGAFHQMPYEEITYEQYADITSRLLPINLSGFSEEGVGESGCSNDGCTF